MRDVTVYWRPMCGYCTKIMQMLREREVPFASVNIWEDRDQATVVQEANGGDELVPTVRVGDRFLPNPSLQEVLSAVEAS